RFTAQIAAGDQLRHNADGDLRHGLRADVEAKGGVDAGQGLVGNALGDEVFVNELDLALAADHADVAGVRRRQVVQGFLVVGVAAGDDHAIHGRVDGAGDDLLEGRTDVAG